MRRWRVIVGMAISTFAVGLAGVALVMALWHGPAARLRIASENGATVINWDAAPMSVEKPGFLDNIPVKINVRFLGLHVVKAAGGVDSFNEYWIPYIWVILGGPIIAVIAQSGVAPRGRRNG
jgi:hypothetical protein